MTQETQDTDKASGQNTTLAFLMPTGVFKNMSEEEDDPEIELFGLSLGVAHLTVLIVMFVVMIVGFSMTIGLVKDGFDHLSLKFFAYLFWFTGAFLAMDELLEMTGGLKDETVRATAIFIAVGIFFYIISYLFGPISIDRRWVGVGMMIFGLVGVPVWLGYKSGRFNIISSEDTSTNDA